MELLAKCVEALGVFGLTVETQRLGQSLALGLSELRCEVDQVKRCENYHCFKSSGDYDKYASLDVG